MTGVGDLAPEFSATASAGRNVRLMDLRGARVVLYFFPTAFTAGWTIEATRVRDAYPRMREAGAELLGVSVDDPETQCEFAASVGAPFPMIGDPNRAIGRLYGVLWPVLHVDRRVTFVIDEAGVVVGRFEHELNV